MCIYDLFSLLRHQNTAIGWQKCKMMMCHGVAVPKNSNKEKFKTHRARTRHRNPTNNAFIALEFCFIYDFLVYFVRVCTFRICHTQRSDGVFWIRCPVTFCLGFPKNLTNNQLKNLYTRIIRSNGNVSILEITIATIASWILIWGCNFFLLIQCSDVECTWFFAECSFFSAWT